MRDLIIQRIKRVVRRYGYEIVRADSTADSSTIDLEFPPDFDEATKATVRSVQGFTMTGPEKLFALCHGVRHIVAHGIPGAIVECGVWRGGSMMAVARTLLEKGDTSRDLYLFDTFQGMPAPTEHDIDIHGVNVLDKWKSQKRNRFTPSEASASLSEVRSAMTTVGYDSSRVHFVKGMVEHTIPRAAPPAIALLRLDTDYYASTRHEMFELYPRLVPGGVLIVDDYGCFKGSEKAVDEFLAVSGEPLLLHRIDYSCRVAVKPGHDLAASGRTEGSEGAAFDTG
jgi:O-methyltransferase